MKHRKLAGYIFLSFAFLLCILFDFVTRHMLDFAEVYISVDHAVTPSAIRIVQLHLYTIILGLLTLGILLASPVGSWLFRLAGLAIDLRTLWSFLTVDRGTRSQTAVRPFVAASSIALVLHLRFLMFGDAEDEGLLENYGLVGFLVSSVILLLAISRLEKSAISNKSIKYTFFLLISIFIFIFGEEISWGQDLFGWNSFGIFETYNFQQETTIHNFFNPLFNYLYAYVASGFYALLLALWFFSTGRRCLWLEIFRPHPGMFVLCSVMAGMAFQGTSEVFELLCSVFSVFYSYRILLVITDPAPELLAAQSAELLTKDDPREGRR